jgi:hypothetical protein
MTPFDFVTGINLGKDVIRTSENPEQTEKEYNPFLTNRALSYFVDTILYSNEMNMTTGLSSKMQFDYLLHSVRPKKRFSKWAKKVSIEDVSVITEYYKYSERRAMEVLTLLSDSHITAIKETLKKGGVKNE